MIFVVIYFLIVVLLIVSWWIVLTKANKPGWAILIPIYNVLVILDVAKKPWWWILLLLIPVVNLVIAIMVFHAISLGFGKGAGFTVGMIFLPFIFIPILAFGDATYQSVGEEAKTEAPVETKVDEPAETKEEGGE